jgi:hypothetical protein
MSDAPEAVAAPLDDHQAPAIDPPPAPADATPDPPLALERAIDACVLANPGLKSRLGAGHPPHTATTGEALQHYGLEGPAGEEGPALRFYLWLRWREVEILREAREAYWGPLRAPARATPAAQDAS